MDADVATTDNVEELSLSLPASNSAAAKQMRVVAGLMMSGRALAYYVFRKTFVTPTNHLDKAIGRLVDAEHQLFVRAVLRRVLPEEQLVNQEAGIEDAIDEILNAVQRWVPDADGFVNRLRPLCEEASRAWILTLSVQNWIAPIFNPSVPEHWRPVPHISAEIASKPDPASQNKQRARNPKPPAPATSSRPNPAKLHKNQIARVVWPLFLATPAENADHEMMSCGYVLTKDQMRDAEEEVAREEHSYKVALQPIKHPGRRQSTTQKKRRNSLSFS